MFGGPIDSLLFAAVLVMAVVAWLRRRSERLRRPADLDVIDRDELEAAEREVRDMGRSEQEGLEGDADGDDWGPGTARPRSRSPLEL